MEQTGNQLKADAPTPLESSLRAKILAAAGSVGPKPGERSAVISKWRRKPMIAWAVAATALTAWCIIYPLTHFIRPPEAMARYATGSSVAPAPSAATEPGGAVADAGGIGGGGGVGGGDVNGYSSSISPATPSAMSGALASPQATPSGGQMMMKMMKEHRPNAIGGQETAAAAAPDDVSVTLENAGEAKKRMAGGVPAHRAVGGKEAVKASDYQSGVKSVFVQITRPRASAATAGAAASPASQDADEAERTVHKEAEITVQVDNVEAKSETVEQIAQGVGGYIADNQLNTGDDNLKTASLTLKVPVAQFQSVLNQVARQGEVKAKSLSGQDLTDEISDEQQAEHTLREDIQTTQQQLSMKLTRLGREERMEQLRDLRTRVAQKQARLKLMHKLGALSTISVELDEKPHPAPAKPHTSGFMNEMNETLHGAVQSMMQAARLPILTFIWILAYAPLWILLILGYRWAVRR